MSRLFGTPVPYALTTALLSLLVVGLDLLDNAFSQDCWVTSQRLGPCPLEWWPPTVTFLSAFLALNLPGQSILAFRKAPAVKSVLIGCTVLAALIALAVPAVSFAHNAQGEACRYVGRRGEWHVFTHEDYPCVPRFLLLLEYLWAITALNLPVHGLAFLYLSVRNVVRELSGSDQVRQGEDGNNGEWSR